MNSREKILEAIKQNKPAEVPVPEMDFTFLQGQNYTSIYIETLTGIGGKATVTHNFDLLKELLQQKLSSSAEVVIGVTEIEGYNIESYRSKTAEQVEGVDIAILRGKIAVAENGSVWISEKDMVNRLLPFICQHLVFVISEQDIVPNMHEAYKRIKADEDGYGVFIAGPSKTADIEQSLVIGAHGPLSLNVFVISE